MIRKIFLFFLGFIFLTTGFLVSAKKFDLNYFLHQPDTVLSPVYPWYSERPTDVKKFLNSENTPFRTKWQKEPFAPYYRYSRDFKRSDYEKWRNLELRGFKIVDEEDLSGQYCNYEESFIGNEFLTNYEIEGRCCVCSVGGEWQCQYTHVKEGRQCQAPDLVFTSVEVTEDETFSSFGQEKYFFETVIKNDSSIDIPLFDIDVVLDGETIGTQTFTNLAGNQQITLSEAIFPSIDNGIIISVGEHELSFVLSAEESKEQNIENNTHLELITVEPPQHDFLIQSVNITQTGDTNEEGQQELAFEVEVENDGDYFARVPASYTIELLTDPDFPPFYSEVVEEALIPGDSFLSEFSIYGDPGSYVFYVRVTPSSDDEANLENNISEVPFTIY